MHIEKQFYLTSEPGSCGCKINLSNDRGSVRRYLGGGVSCRKE